MIPKALYLSALALGGLLLALPLRDQPKTYIHAGSDAPAASKTPASTEPPQDAVSTVSVPSLDQEQYVEPLALQEAGPGNNSTEHTPPSTASPPATNAGNAVGRPTFASYCGPNGCGPAMKPQQWRGQRRGLFNGRFRR